MRRTYSFQLNPLQVARLDVTFRDARGRFCIPSKGIYFEITPPGHRKPLQGEIPKEYRRTVALRLQYIASLLIAFSKKKAIEKAKTERKKVKKRVQAKKKAGPSKKDLSFQKRVKAKTEKAIREERIKPSPIERIEKKVVVSHTEEKYVQRSGIHHDPRHRNSREGPIELKDRQLLILKRQIDFDPDKPIELYSFNWKATLIAVREFFTPHALKFLNDVRNDSQNAYILRVKTLNRIEGEHSTREAIGTERFRIHDHLEKREIPGLRRLYPGLTNDQILKKIQIEDMLSELRELFLYFMNRYQDYLSKKIISSIAITGFSIEVVQGVMT